MSLVYASTSAHQEVPEKVATVQKLLDENSRLIEVIKECQIRGSAHEASKHQQLLHRNLMMLAQVADQSLLNSLSDDGNAQTPPASTDPLSVPSSSLHGSSPSASNERPPSQTRASPNPAAAAAYAQQQHQQQHAQHAAMGPQQMPMQPMGMPPANAMMQQAPVSSAAFAPPTGMPSMAMGQTLPPHAHMPQTSAAPSFAVPMPNGVAPHAMSHQQQQQMQHQMPSNIPPHSAYQPGMNMGQYAQYPVQMAPSNQMYSGYDGQGQPMHGGHMFPPPMGYPGGHPQGVMGVPHHMQQGPGSQQQQYNQMPPHNQPTSR